jgi:hypothetical protein
MWKFLQIARRDNTQLVNGCATIGSSPIFSHSLDPGRSNNEEKRTMEGGAVAVLRKPVSDGLLFNAIQAALNRS